MAIRIGDNVLNNSGTATFNGTNLTKIIYNGTTVWQAIPSLCVTINSELVSHVESCIITPDNLSVSAGTYPSVACITFSSGGPIDEERCISFIIKCNMTFCTCASKTDGTLAYVDNKTLSNYKCSCACIAPNTTSVNACVQTYNTGTCFRPDSYEVCPEGTVLPNGITSDITLDVYDSATGVSCIFPWVCGRTYILS